MTTLRILKAIVLSRFLWLMVVLGILGVFTDQWVEAAGGAKAAVAHWGVWAPIAAFVIKTLTTITPVGAVVLSVVLGALFPFWLAFLINLFSGVVAGVAMYFVWRRGDHEFDIRARMQRLPLWLRRHAGDNLPFLVLLRLLPWAGGSVADMIAGSHRIRMRTQVLSLLIGYAPGAVIYSLAGSGLVKL